MSNVSGHTDCQPPRLGLPNFPSPLFERGGLQMRSEMQRILMHPLFEADAPPQQWPSGDVCDSFVVAHADKNIFFAPQETRAAIVTCGGICPGLNAVIRALVLQLRRLYGVSEVLGLRFGYQAFASDNDQPYVTLESKDVEKIGTEGGTILGTSRGTPGAAQIVDQLQKWNVNVMFVIGGDGSMRGAAQICDEIAKRNLPIAVVGIPKTIDNDILFVRRSFGFQTAVENASRVIDCARAEATGARGGIGLVKFMGRNAGYIAAHACLASGHVDFCLVPEISFKLDRLLSAVREVLVERGSCVLVVAEGAGQEFFAGQPVKYDASGNKKLFDIGDLLKREITASLEGEKHTLKYIDPSYIIRSAAPNATDQEFCAQLARAATHAAMSGYTRMMIGFWHGCLTYVPLSMVTAGQQTIDPKGELWFNVLETTGQYKHLA